MNKALWCHCSRASGEPLLAHRCTEGPTPGVRTWLPTWVRISRHSNPTAKFGTAVTYCWRMTYICDSNQLPSASYSWLSEK